MITTVITTGSIIANRFRTSAAPLSAEKPRVVSSFKTKMMMMLGDFVMGPFVTGDFVMGDFVVDSRKGILC